MTRPVIWLAGSAWPVAVAASAAAAACAAAGAGTSIMGAAGTVWAVVAASVVGAAAAWAAVDAADVAAAVAEADAAAADPAPAPPAVAAADVPATAPTEPTAVVVSAAAELAACEEASSEFACTRAVLKAVPVVGSPLAADVASGAAAAEPRRADFTRFESPWVTRRSPAEAMLLAAEVESAGLAPDRSARDEPAARDSGCQIGDPVEGAPLRSIEREAALKRTAPSDGDEMFSAWESREVWLSSLADWASAKASLKVGSSGPAGMLTWPGIGTTPGPSVTLAERPAIVSALPGRRRASRASQ
jgi:hypothetical protein